MVDFLARSALVAACLFAGRVEAQPALGGTLQPGDDATYQEQPARSPWWIAGAAHVSFLGDLIDRPTLLFRFGFALQVGRRWGPWGGFVQLEEDFWSDVEFELRVRRGALNLGPGVEYLYFDGRVRASLAVGPSILLSHTAVHDRGHVGLFVDLRPTGLRLVTSEHWVVQLDPLTFTVEAPVLGSPSVVEIQYRSVLRFEYDL